jgi:Subtilase family
MQKRFFMNFIRRRFAMFLASLIFLVLIPGTVSAIVSSNADPTSIFNGVNINQLIGAETFYINDYWGANATIANVEAGFIWNGHDTLGKVTTFIADPSVVQSPVPYDFHATMVGEVLAGVLPQLNVNFGGLIFTFNAPYTYGFTGTLDDGTNFNTSALTGIAPSASLWSAAVATSWNFEPDHSQELVGGFNLTPQSLSYAYTVSMLTGSGGKTADVINSSWGDSSTHDGSAFYTKIIDALAYSTHKTVVMAAGNDGVQTDDPAAGYNGISVAATSSDTSSPVYAQAASFSNRGPIPFYNPQTGKTILNARAGVDIAAPGDNLTLAFYGGMSGGHDPLFPGASDPSNGSGGYYFYNMGGTSFSSPVVAGGAALVVDVGKSKFGSDVHAIDGRVVKAVLLNSADKNSGWNNGQTMVSGVITTTQALDYSVGAGLLNLDRTYSQYTAGTTDLASLTGGTVQNIGWAFGHASPASANDYYFADPLHSGKLAVTLTWFVDRKMNDDGISASDVMMSNLDLEVFRVVDPNTSELVAQSISDYNNVEHLYFDIANAGDYFLRVLYAGEIYNLSGSPSTGEDYGLAWFYAVPEPSILTLLAAAFPAILMFQKARRQARRAAKSRMKDER